MSSLLRSTANTRAVIPGSLRCLRSDALTAPTDEDVAFLLSRGVTTLIDLRTDAERLRRPCPLAEDTRFTYHALPATGGDAIPASPDGVAASYIRMVDGQMDAILRTIQTAESGVLFFCTAGKDRTGVVSALLQHRTGMPRDAIIADYLLSGENLADRLHAYQQQHPEIDPAICTPQERYMAAFLDWLEKHP